MKGYEFAAYSPLEVGDSVLARLSPLCTTDVRKVEDVYTVHSGKTGEVRIMYKLSNVSRPVPIDYIVARLVDGDLLPLSEEMAASKEVTL